MSALVAAIGFASAAFAQNDSIYGESYTKVQSVIGSQTQIVMYRGLDNGKEAAHVYIDGELQSALMPGGYTAFCVPAGEHSVESYIGDAPLYTGKRNPQAFAKFSGGQTYVLEAPVAAGQSTPIVHTGKDADQSLQGLRKQIHVISRASSVTPCQTVTKLSLRSDVLFHFGKGGYNDLTGEGRAELDRVVQEIKQGQEQIKGIEVVGHADPIGKAAANQRLSQQRAETVRRVLLEQGIQSELVHASGRGSSEPIVNCGVTRTAANIACNAPNRRVELVIGNVRNDG
ncbi:hypothetical protein UB43_13740 [Pseudomonas sp. 21]|nr:hypothetical protein UB43_13740 [Pseudomonas sp. 21]